MAKYLISLSFLLSTLFTVQTFASQTPVVLKELSASENTADSESFRLYNELGLKEINYEAFRQALSGYNQIRINKKEILTLIDFSKASTEERLYVIDIQNRKVLFKSHVAHGRNSGDNYATSFSNKSGSFKSSLGFFLTGETYQGKNGYSLKLDGLEKNINDKARERAIVIHGAIYANPNKSAARLGRSLGCPALPTAVNKKVIDIIKDGSVLYIYAKNQEYTQSSVFLNQPTSKEWYLSQNSDKKVLNL